MRSKSILLPQPRKVSSAGTVTVHILSLTKDIWCTTWNILSMPEKQRNTPGWLKSWEREALTIHTFYLGFWRLLLMSKCMLNACWWLTWASTGRKTRRRDGEFRLSISWRVRGVMDRCSWLSEENRGFFVTDQCMMRWNQLIASLRYLAVIIRGIQSEKWNSLNAGDGIEHIMVSIDWGAIGQWTPEDVLRDPWER